MTQELEQRLARMEASQRRLRRTATGLAIALGAVGLMSFAAPPLCHTVWAERFVLKDSSGRERMRVDAYSQKSPTLTFQDADGKPVATLQETNGEMKLMLFGEGGAKTLPLSEALDKEPSVN